MAESQITDSPGTSPAKPRPKKLLTRIDFTPMVDLGFLLITFFMLTTTLNKPQVMALAMPDDGGDFNPLPQSKALTLLLGAGDKVYWYEGIDNTKLDSTNYSPAGLRQVILKKMEKVNAQWGMQNYSEVKTGEAKQGSFLNVIIKPTQASRYKNLVDVLDEMAICHVRFYCILDISDAEQAFLRNPATGLNFTP